MRHVFIVNPAAGKRDMTEDIRSRAKEIFQRRGEPFVVERTEYSGHAIEIAAKYAADGEPTRFYACGGDGTLNEVVNGMYKYSHCSVAPYPCGTGNDLIKCMGADAKKRFLDIEALADGDECMIDLISSGHRISLNVASVGYDVTVAMLVQRFKRLPLVSGNMAYILAVIYSFFNGMRFRYSFVVDGEEIPEEDFIFATFCNGRYYGGGFLPAPKASLQDGLMDLVLVRAVSRFDVIKLVGAYKNGTVMEKRPDIIIHRTCKHVSMCSKVPMLVNYEGETIPHDTLEMKIMPAALRFVVPKGYSNLSREYGKTGVNL